MDNRYLCKAKRLDTGEWAYGYYVPLRDGGHHYIFAGTIDITGLYPTFNRVEIDPATLCRCTGHLDKRANLIWEHDKVRYPDYHLESGDAEIFVNEGIVEWDQESMRFYFTEREIIDMEDIDILTEVEVIGNRFDD